jgi:hypothetical protein
MRIALYCTVYVAAKVKVSQPEVRTADVPKGV